MSTFLLEIITPEKIAYCDQVEMVSSPSAEGIIGILPHHIPLFTRLIEGEIKIIKSGEEIYLAIGGGFMQVAGDKVTILVTQAYHADEINENEVTLAKKRAEEALAARPTGVALADAQALFRRSTIALKVLKRKRGNVRPA